MNPTIGVQMDWAPLMCLAHWDPGPSAAAHGLLIQDNTISGKANWAIYMDNGASHNIVRRNNMEDFTAVPFGPYGASLISIMRDCHGNVFRDNIIGPLGPGAGVGIYCAGDNNDFIRNDYTKSGIPGLTAGGIPCVMLANTYDPATGDLVAEPENNLVFESGGLPPGTTAAEQVLDQPRELTGATTNTVVGH